MRQGAKARTTKQQARIQRFEALEPEVKQETQEQALTIQLAQSRIGKRVFQLDHVDLTIACKEVVHQLEWIIQSQARIGIVGANGIGKSTFLNALAGLQPFDNGQFIVGETVRIAYYKQQDEDIPMDKQVIQYLREVAEEVMKKNGEVASVTELLETFLFPRYMHGAYIHTLSGGERRRLYLLTLLMTKPNVLLLDEPTNDLDIDTLTVLESYIQEFNGAVITVSHDRYFLDKVTDVLFALLGDGRSELYYGSMSDYLATHSVDTQANNSATSVTTAQQPGQAMESKEGSPPKKMTYAEKKEWEGLEEAISDLEASIHTIQTAMAANSSDFAQLQALQTELDTQEAALATAYERWDYLAELSEN